MPGKFFLYPFQVGEELTLKKKHPCGGQVWQVLRIGAEIQLRCKTCGKQMILIRSKLEKMCVRIDTPGEGV